MIVAAIDRCLRLIEILAESAQALPLAELAQRLQLPKSAVHRMLATLAARGYVAQDPKSQLYEGTLRLATLAFRHLDIRHLPDAAQGILDRLATATGEYCRLALVEGDGLVWVARAQGATQGLRYDPDMSEEVILHATATGKAWLATLPENEALRVVYLQGFKSPANAGKNLIQDVDALRSHLAETRRRGYATSIEEAEAGTVALASAFGAWDGPEAPVVGTLSVAGPLMRMGRERRDAIAGTMLAAAREMAIVWSLHKRQRNAGTSAPSLRQLTSARRNTSSATSGAAWAQPPSAPTTSARASSARTASARPPRLRRSASA